MKRSSIKEKYLIYKVRQKDAEAYGQLYDFYVDRIYRYIFFKVATREDAEDLTSEVFLKTWEYIKKTNKKIDNLNALFYRVARNSVIDYYRTRKTKLNVTDEEYMQNISDSRDIEAEVNIKVEFANIELHLNKLKEDYKDILILKYLEEFSIAEIAEITSRTKGNVRVLLHRATKALKEIAGEN